MRRDIELGDRVMFSTTFLRSIGCHTGRPCFARGTVTAVRRVGGRSGVTVATVAWNDPHEGDTVAVANLVREDEKHLECIK